jgi:hypothetical protein
MPSSLESMVVCACGLVIGEYVVQQCGEGKAKTQTNQKTYNSRYSLVVTHPTTNLPISSLCMAERTGCPVFLSLWSYVLVGWGLGDMS